MVLVEAVTLLEEKQPHCVGALVPAICIGYVLICGYLRYDTKYIPHVYSTQHHIYYMCGMWHIIYIIIYIN